MTFFNNQRLLTPKWMIWSGPEFELVWDITPVLATCQFNRDLINNERASMESPFSHYSLLERTTCIKGKKIAPFESNFRCLKSSASRWCHFKITLWHLMWSLFYAEDVSFLRGHILKGRFWLWSSSMASHVMRKPAVCHMRKTKTPLLFAA